MLLAPALIMTISYSHDMATALLAASGAGLWMLDRSYPAAATPATQLFFVRAFHGITRLAKYSLIWIVVAGVPRIMFYREYEWADAAGDLQVIAIIIKHVAMFLIVGTGLFYWAKLGRKVRFLKKE